MVWHNGELSVSILNNNKVSIKRLKKTNIIMLITYTLVERIEGNTRSVRKTTSVFSNSVGIMKDEHGFTIASKRTLVLESINVTIAVGLGEGGNEDEACHGKANGRGWGGWGNVRGNNSY